MFWLLAIPFVLLVALGLIWPMIKPAPPQERGTAELSDYKAQLERLEREISEAEPKDRAELNRKKTAFQKQILDLYGDKQSQSAAAPKPGFAVLLACIFIVSGLGLYGFFGAPGLKPNAQQQASPSFTDLVTQLEAQLEKTPGDVRGWVLYARSLVQLRRFTDAEQAYEKAIELSGNDPDIVQEYNNLQAFLSPETPRGPTAEQVEAAEAMSVADRQAMVQSMVDGLSSRLRSESGTPAEWVRLLRSRKVLGQRDEGVMDVQSLKSFYADDPDVVAKILTESEWDSP